MNTNLKVRLEVVVMAVYISGLSLGLNTTSPNLDVYQKAGSGYGRKEF